MKVATITRSKLKELIKQTLDELKFGSQAQYDAYKKKHKIKSGTTIDIAGKKSTHKDKGKISKASAKKADKWADDMNAKLDAAEKLADKEKQKNISNDDKDKLDKLAKMMSKEKGKKGDLRDKAKKPEDVKNDTQDFITGKNAESNIDKLNDLAMDDKPVQFDTDDGQSLTWDDGDYDSDVVYALDQDGEEVVVPFDNIVRLDMDLPDADKGNMALFSDPQESIKESVKPRRYTVKEVQRWMKTLEENRYRKLVKADCRRVAWLVNNNLAEDYENMPGSIRKRWSKAAYGKERYLAREFMKYRKKENKIRESIRSVLNKAIKSYKKNKK